MLLIFCLQILDNDGIAAPGEIVRNHDVLVNKYAPKNTGDRHPSGTPMLALLYFYYALLCVLMMLMQSFAHMCMQ